MPLISKKGDLMPQSPIRKLVPYAEAAKENGTNYKLLKSFNPWLRAKSLPDKSRRKYVLKIPQNSETNVFHDFATKVDRIQ